MCKSEGIIDPMAQRRSNGCPMRYYSGQTETTVEKLNGILTKMSASNVGRISSFWFCNNPQIYSRGSRIPVVIINEFYHILAESQVNSLRPSDAKWRQRSWTKLVQVMACCLTAPSHYLNQYWLIISNVLWHLSEDILMRRSEDTNQ